MKPILLFEAWSVNQIANGINQAVSGMGTDEEALVTAILQIPDRNTVIAVNKLMTGSDQFAYGTIGDAIEGELGMFDSSYKEQIDAHFKKIGATDLLKAAVMPPTPAEKIIADIIPRVKQHEGVKPKVYKDTKGIPTVGVGFNLNRGDSVEKLKAVGANPARIKAGQAQLTTQQIDKLLMQDLMDARKNAEEIISTFNRQPAQVQGVLIEMAFNLGRKGLSEFKNFITAINSNKYDEAATEMLNSSWANQVGDRAVTLSEIIKKA